MEVVDALNPGDLGLRAQRAIRARVRRPASSSRGPRPTGSGISPNVPMLTVTSTRSRAWNGST